MSIASLPMYDWPEVRAETDALWSAIRDGLRTRGVDAPDALDRTRGPAGVWTDPALVLSQTCGMPWRLGLHRDAALVGTPDYGVEGCAPGYYNSVIIVRADDLRAALTEFAGAACAFNAENSQSGYAAMREAAGPMVFARWLETGAHAASVAAVAEGRADVTAIDAVTWRFAQRFQPEAAGVRELARTAPTPGLPFITSLAQNAEDVFEAVEAGIAGVDEAVRAALGVRGVVRISSAEYLRVD